MKDEKISLPPEVVLGDTHFTVGGDAEITAFSEAAIQADQRLPEVWSEMIRRLDLTSTETSSA